MNKYFRPVFGQISFSAAMANFFKKTLTNKFDCYTIIVKIVQLTERIDPENKPDMELCEIPV